MAYLASAVAGTLLQLEKTASPNVFVTIKGVEGFQGPTGTKPSIDVTAIDDTSAQFVSGLPDYGEVRFRLFWDPDEATHAQLLASFQATDSSDDFKIVAANDGAAAGTFTGEVTGWQHDFSRGAAMTVEVTVKLTGAITWTP